MFGHVERMDKENPVINYRFIEIGGQRVKVRPCQTWNELINDEKVEIAARICTKSSGLEKGQRRTPSNPCYYGNGCKTKMMMMIMVTLQRSKI